MLKPTLRVVLSSIVAVALSVPLTAVPGQGADFGHFDVSWADNREIQATIDYGALARATDLATINAEIGANDFRISSMGPDGDINYEASDPSVVYNAMSNEFLVVWSGDDNTGSLVNDEYEIYGQCIDVTTGAKIGARIRISDMGPEGNSNVDALTPSVAYNSEAGDYLVVWQGDDSVNDEFEIYGQRLSASGSEVGINDFRISDMGPDGNPSYSAYFPSVTYNSTANEYLVVWRGDDDTSPLVDDELEIFIQRLNSSGTELGANDHRISDMGPDGNPQYDAYSPSVIYNNIRNEYLVVWRGDDNTGPMADEEFEIYAQRLAVTGQETGLNDIRLSDMGPDGDPNYDALDTALAYNGTNDEYLVGWYGDENNAPLVNDEFEVFVQRMSGGGAELGLNDVRISDMGPDSNSQYGAFNVSATYNAGEGEFVVVWHGDDNVGTLVDDESEIFGQRISVGGIEVGPNDFRLSDMGNDGSSIYVALVPVVSVSTQRHDYFVAWQGFDNTPPLSYNESEIFGQQFVSTLELFLPLVTRNYIVYFAGPNEVEDNDTAAQANGPLISGQNYFGYPNDDKDYFSIYTLSSGQIVISLTNYAGSGGQLQLFYQSTANRVAADVSPPFQITYSGLPGTYYIYIYTESGFNTTNAYTLRVTYPAP